MTIDDVRLLPLPNPETTCQPSRQPESLFHSAPWRDAVESAFGLEIRRFIPSVDRGGRAYYSLVSDIRGDRVVSTPFSDFCDPLLGEAGWMEFSEHLRSFEVPVTVRPFRHRWAIDDPAFERRCDLLWHGIDISNGFDNVWDGLKSKTRTAIRRAAKAGITFRVSSAIEDLEAFHTMHVELRKSKYQLLAQPFEFFAALHEGFGDDMAIVIAEEYGEPIAAMVYLAWNGVWYYKFSASRPRKYRPNAALLMEACRHGTERGLDLVDMGRSNVDQPGLVSFKQQFATEELALSTLHWQPASHSDPKGDAVSSALGDVTALLTHPDVPDEVTAKGGSLLYRYFS